MNSLPPPSVTAAVVSAPAAASRPLLTASKTRHILIRLGYLPLTAENYLGRNGQVQRQYTWNFVPPRALLALSRQDSWQDPWNPLVLGALYQFEHEHGLPVEPGKVGLRDLPVSVEMALLAARKPDPLPWTWVLVTKFPRPERIHVFVAGKGWVLQSDCNTGVLHGTPDGTWPVYARDEHTSMVGSFPIPVPARQVRLYDAAKAAGFHVADIDFGRYHHHWVRYQPYDDPDIRWVNYFDRGRAVHFYPRAAYGFPQSAGCVELPRKAAQQAFAVLHYGTPVTVAHSAPGPWNAPASAKGAAKPRGEKTIAALPSLHWTYRVVPQQSSPRSVHLALTPVALPAHAAALPDGTPRPAPQPQPDRVAAGSAGPGPAARAG